MVEDHVFRVPGDAIVDYRRGGKHVAIENFGHRDGSLIPRVAGREIPEEMHSKMTNEAKSP